MKILISSLLFEPLWLFIFCDCYTLVRKSDNPETILLLSNGQARIVPLNSTWIFKKIGFENVEIVSPSVLNEFHFKNTIITIERQDQTIDENHRLFLLKIDSLQDRIIEDISFIGYAKNPSLIHWNDRCLVVAQTLPHMISFKWMGTEDFLLNSLCYSNVSTQDIDNLNTLPFVGLDQRIVVVDQKLVLILYSSFRGGPRGNSYAMSLAELRKQNLTSFSLKSYNIDFLPNHKYWNRDIHEKNWCPFIHNNSLYLIQNINPLRVVNLENYDPFSVVSDNSVNETSLYVNLVSEAMLEPLPWWEFGDLRGGTNAVLVGDRFLALFHSRPKLHGADLLTYFFGAYTFSTEVPFRLLSVSNVPIVNDYFYTGPWTSNKVTYGPYPTTLTIEGKYLRVVMGYNDIKGFVLSFLLEKVLQSLVQVDRI